MKYKKYIVFRYNSYYPSGALDDIAGSFDTLEEAKKLANKDYSEFGEVVDRDTWETVYEKD